MSGTDSSLLRATLPPTPEPGSARYFTLLYTPAARRPALARLLALADEIGAGVARALDHEVAHARLEWWRYEAGQYAAGRAQHPWLRARHAEPAIGPPFDLHALVQAAAIDLAQGLQGPMGGERLRRAVFMAAAQVLGAGPFSPAQRDALGELGALSWQLERPATAPQSALPAVALQPVLAGLGAALQPKLAPLLVWAAIAAQGAKDAAPLQSFANNIRAWSVARRAAAGTFTR
jgi:hypothetical protein